MLMNISSRLQKSQRGRSPKVVREPKPKAYPKPKTPKKPAVKGQESNTPKRKCVRKKKEVTKVQESTALEESAALEDSTPAKKVRRRALDFENRSFEPENREIQSNSSGTKHSEKDVSIFDSKGYSFTSQASASRVLAMEESCKSTFQGRQSCESNVRLDKIDTPTKKRTTGHARFRNLSSISEVSQQLQAGSYSRPQSNKNVKTRVTSSKKKRITKSQKSQTNQLTVLPNHRQFPTSFAVPPDEIWKQIYSVEAISEQLPVLDINRENSETALVPYAMNSTGDQIIIFTNGAGAIVPSAAPVKKRRVRAKVDLDNETDRMWKLLMENINSEGDNGSDEQKVKWWEEERNVFRGRADSFIARMHLVQGDRRFTPWKGSVVDSVVGVFLTQNVSDHLSSSAFMSLAAKFPAPVVPSSDFDVGTSSLPSISNPPVHNQISVIENNTQPEVEKDHANSNDTSRSSSEIASSGHESVLKTTDSKAQVDLDRTGSRVEVNKTDQTYLVQDLFPSEDSALTCQNSLVSDAPKNTERAGSSSEINSKGEHYDSYMKPLESLGCAELHRKRRGLITADTVSVEESNQKKQCSRQEVRVLSNPGSLQVSPNTSPGDCSLEVKDFKSLKGRTKSSDDNNEPCCCFGDALSVQKRKIHESSSSVLETSISDINESTNCLDVQEGTEKQPRPDSIQHGDSIHHGDSSCKEHRDKATLNSKGKKVLKEEKEGFDWDSLRREAQGREGKREKTSRTMDSVDWEAIRTADVLDVAETIKSRGMNHKLAERIQGFLNRLLTEHGSLDLEWLRDVQPDKAKEYLLSFKGLGLKSVECVRLLTLHHLAFPVDTNVGRIAVRLGWVPLQPLPESLQLHLLEMYPVLDSIQKYLWPRLCKLDQKTLYELHYQMITFGKVFCTKSKPNCNACPMKGECRHFASAFASARLALPGSEKGMGPTNLPLHSLPEPLGRQQGLEVIKHSEVENRVTSCEPIIEEPPSPEPICAEVLIADIEDAFNEDPEEIPTIRLNIDEFTSNLKKIMEQNKELRDGNMSTALVALTDEAASLPMPKLKNISQLRTEHHVYELPDSHPLLAEFEKRESDDPCSYLLAIWTPGETFDSVLPAVSKCISQDIDRLCDEEPCFSCNSIKEARSQTVRGTILIPCRTAMRGSFPLNGTYFQVNEVFADHDSSLTPIDVPREWLWNLARRTVYFGTSIPTIFKGLSTETIQQCFWRGYVCVRGFERKTGAPRPLMARLHFPLTKMKKFKKTSDRSRAKSPARTSARETIRTDEVVVETNEQVWSRVEERLDSFVEKSVEVAEVVVETNKKVGRDVGQPVESSVERDVEVTEIVVNRNKQVCSCVGELVDDEQPVGHDNITQCAILRGNKRPNTGKGPEDRGSKKRRMEQPRDPELSGGSDLPGGSPYGIVFGYAGEHRLFPCDKRACAQLAQMVSLGAAPYPNVDDFPESNSLQCLSQALVQAMVHLSHVADGCQRKLQASRQAERDARAACRATEVQAEKRLTNLQKALEVEKAKTARYDKLKKLLEEEKKKHSESVVELAELKGKLAVMAAELDKRKVSSTRLQAERDASHNEVSLFRRNSQTAKKAFTDEKAKIDRRTRDYKTKCAAKFQKIQLYLEGMKNAQQTIFNLSRVVGTRECLQILVDEDGVMVSASRFAHLKEDEAAYRADLKKIDVPELFPEDLVQPSLALAVTVVGPGVAPLSSRPRSLAFSTTPSSSATI